MKNKAGYETYLIRGMNSELPNYVMDVIVNWKNL